MSGGKGGSTTSSVEIPEYIEEAARRNLAKAEDISQIGYVPYYGPDVAAFTPFQEAGFQQTADVASAFGVGPQMSRSDIMGGMPAPTEFAGGVRGYSSAPLYQQAVDALAAKRPAQAQFIDSFFIDPVTGQVGSRVPAEYDYTSPAEYDYTSPVAPVDSGGGGVAPIVSPVSPVAPVATVVPDTVLTPTELSDYATIIAGDDYDPRIDILTPEQRAVVESATPEGTAARIAQEDIAMNIPFPDPVTEGGGLLSNIGDFITSGGFAGAALRGVGGLLEPALGAAESGIASMIGDPRTFAQRDADRLEAERLRAIDRSQEESARVESQREAARTEQEKLKVADPDAFVAQFGKEGQADAKKAVETAQKLAVAPRPPSVTSGAAKDWIKSNIGVSVNKKDATDYIRSLQQDWDRQNRF
jgi:hypothetical protein